MLNKLKIKEVIKILLVLGKNCRASLNKLRIGKRTRAE